MIVKHLFTRRFVAAVFAATFMFSTTTLLAQTPAKTMEELIAEQNKNARAPVQTKKEETTKDAAQAAGKDGAVVETKTETETDSVGVTFGNEIKNNWKVGVQIRAGSQAVRGMFVTLPVPTDWPEQAVSLVEEDFPDEVKDVKYRVLDNGIKQIVAKMGTIRPGEIVKLSATFQVRTLAVKAPAETTIFKVPKSPARNIKEYLGVSPQITYRHQQLRKQVKEITADKEHAWEQVKAIHQWIIDNVQHRAGEPQDTLAVLRSKQGCAEDLSCLFVAMCRSHKVPSRIVWVDGNQYAEFYLVDNENEGHWFPAQTAGLAEFGSMSDPRIVLEKGDNFRVPEKKDRQKFVREFATGKGKAKPALRFTRDLLPAK